MTEEDVEASLGNSLPQCLGEVFGVVEERSEYSDELLRLVAEEVAKRVNCTLALTGQPASFQGSEDSVEYESSPFSTVDIITQVVKILIRVLEKFSIQRPDIASTFEFSTEEPDIVYTFEEFGTEEPANEPKVEEFNTEEPANELMVEEFSTQDFDGESMVEFCTEEPANDLMVEEFSEQDFDGESMVEFCTEEPANDLVVEEFSEQDFDGESMVEFSTEEPDIKTTVEEEFGSAKLEEATRKSPSFFKKVTRFFRRNKKVAPACEVAQPEKKQKRSAGMFRAVARILRKPFTCCISCGSQDD